MSLFATMLSMGLTAVLLTNSMKMSDMQNSSFQRSKQNAHYLEISDYVRSLMAQDGVCTSTVSGAISAPSDPIWANGRDSSIIQNTPDSALPIDQIKSADGTVLFDPSHADPNQRVIPAIWKNSYKSIKMKVYYDDETPSLPAAQVRGGPYPIRMELKIEREGRGLGGDVFTTTLQLPMLRPGTSTAGATITVAAAGTGKSACD